MKKPCVALISLFVGIASQCIGQVTVRYAAPVDLTVPGFTFDGGAFNVSSQDTDPVGIALNEQGTRMFILGLSERRVFQYTLASPFNTTTGVTFSGSSFNVNTQTTFPTDLTFNPAGSRMFVTGLLGSQATQQYSLSTSFDISSGITHNGSFSVVNPHGTAFNRNGTRVFVLGGTPRTIRQFTLSTAYQVSSGVTDEGVPVDISAQDVNTQGFVFNANGTKLFVVGNAGRKIYQYALATRFDISTGLTYQGSLDLSTQVSTATALAINPTNTSFYVVGSNKVNQYSQDAYVFKETINGAISGSMILTIAGDNFTNAGGSLTSPTHFTITNLPAGLTPVLAVHSSGAYATLTLSGNASVVTDVASLQFTFTNAAFSATAAASVTNAIAYSTTLGIDFNERFLTYAPKIDITSPGVSHAGTPKSLTAQLSVPVGMAFNLDGTRLYATGLDAKVHQYTLTKPYDIVASSFYEASPFDLSSQVAFPQDLEFSRDGKTMFVVGSVEKKVFQYALTTAFDTRTGCVYTGYSLDVSAQGASPTGIAFHKDGTRMLIVDNDAKVVNQYNLSHPFDLSTGVTSVGSFSLSAQNQSPRGITFDPTGKKMFIVCEGDDEVNQYTLQTPYNTVSTVTFDGSPFNVAAQESNPTDISFSGDGSKMLIIGLGGDEINQYNVPLVRFEETTANNGAVSGSMYVSAAGGVSFLNVGSTLTHGTHYSISNLPAGLAPQLSVSSSSLATLTFTGNASSHDNLSDVGSLQFTFQNTALTISASVVTGAIAASSGFAIDFDDIPSVSYHSPIDITQAGFVTHNPGVSNTTPQDLIVQDVEFNATGTKMYVVSNVTRKVSQYSLSTPYEVLSGVTFDGTPLDISAYNTAPTGLTFNSTGSKMFIVGNDKVNQFSLSTPFNTTSGVTHDGSPLSVLADMPTANGIAFSPNGSLMFLGGSNVVVQYSLPSSYNITTGATLDGSLSIAAQETAAGDLSFSPDGTKLFVSGAISKLIHQFSLAVPFSVTSGVTASGSPYNTTAQGYNPNGIAISSSSKKMFTAGINNPITPTLSGVNQYSLATTGFVETAANNGAVSGSLIVRASGELFTHAGGTLTIGTDVSIGNVPTGLTPVVSVSSGGQFVTLTFTGNAVNSQNSDDVSDLVFTFANSAFVAGSAAGVTNAISASTGIGIDFNDNSPPQFTSSSSASFSENATGAVIDVNANNGEGGAADADVTYSLTGGSDILLFSINSGTGSLTFLTPPNFEDPQDANDDNAYVVVVTAGDGVFTTDQTVTISVTNINETPFFVSSSSVSVNENGTAAIDVNAQNGDNGGVDVGMSYSFSGGVDQALFSINTTNGIVTFLAAPDFEFPSDVGPYNSYVIEVTASDGVHSIEQEVIINVQDINEPPFFISASTVTVAENTTGFLIQFFAHDGDDGSLNTSITYSISGGPDEAAFNVTSPPGTLSFVTPRNYEIPTDADSNNEYEVTVSAFDGVQSTPQEITVTITNVNDNPIFTSPNTATFTENGAGTVIDVQANNGDQGATDAGLTYSFGGGADFSRFNIDPSTGVLTFKSSPDFDVPIDLGGNNVYEVLIAVHDGLNAATQTISITVLNVDEEPVLFTPTAITFQESGTGIVVDANATNGDGGSMDSGITFTLGGADASAFTINAATGVVMFLSAPDFEHPADADGDNIYQIQVAASDGVNSSAVDITVTVTNLADNLPPQISNQTFSVNSGSSSGTIVGTIEVSDPDGDPVGLAITSGNTNNAFTINDSRQLVVSNSSAVNHNIQPIIFLTVQALDGLGGVGTAAITININQPGNAQPIIAVQTFTTFEGSATGTLVGTVVASDPDGDPLQFSIIAGNSGGAFAIDPGTALLSVTNASALSGAATFSLTVTVTDGKGGSASANITVNVSPTPSGPNAGPAINAQTFSIPAGSANGTIVATLEAWDPEGDPFQFSIIAGNGNNVFAVDAATGVLSINNSVALGFSQSYSLTVRVENEQGNDSASITINVLTRPPVLSDHAFMIDEHSAAGTLVGTIAASDPDNDPLTFSIVTGNISNAFVLSPNSGELRVNNPAGLDFETTPRFTITVEVNDGHGGTDTGIITVDLKLVIGVAKPVTEAITVFPNPTTGLLYVGHGKPGDHAVVIITDIVGRKVLELMTPGNGSGIDISELPAGIYVVTIVTENTTLNRKIEKLNNR